MPMQIRRTSVPNTPPTGLAEGQLAIGMADAPPTLWVGVPTSIDPAGRRVVNPQPGLFTATTPGIVPAAGATANLFLNSSGGFTSLPPPVVQTPPGSYAAQPGDDWIKYAGPLGASPTLTLPPTASTPGGKVLRLTLQNMSAPNPALTIVAAGSNTISVLSGTGWLANVGTVAVQTTTPNGEILFICDADSGVWRLINQGPPLITLMTNTTPANQYLPGTNAPRISTSLFTSSGIYTPVPGLSYALVECAGAGGGGGSSFPSAGANAFGGGGGGGSGAYSRSILTAAQIGASQSVTIGAGIAAGAGGTTSFGTLVTAPGGSPGAGFDGGSGLGQGGAGGTRGTGQFTLPGSDGSPGMSWAFNTTGGRLVKGGDGGVLFAGMRGQNATGGAAPGSAPNPNTGAGGEGGAQNTPGGAWQIGADGSSGWCFVTEFAF